ncbi:hypothetical protein GGI64_002165 [Rhizobium leguminosarum]|nr:MULTISPECIES: hypothetical protein [Rhizobium]KPH10246.1 hypothetical protein AOG23_01625 [Rhizobium acidisoli]EJB03806.1 hypothetical protein Rleg9DRAFT_2645 [Rhizobium leguminosarum bv. trifolii WSM597]MBB3650246.1 hypothetical protein [Rhizobium sp. BK619]NYJ11114.1 hypothetical protein [Rhizobium leguminosarum]QAS80664.1 hypothetical protein CO657_03680 [Rhizobium acidisoli]
MLAFMETWPAPAVYGLVGGIFGAIGAVVGHLAAKRFPNARTIIVVLFLASSSQITKLIVIPRIQNDVANANLPQKIDAFTTLERISLEGKTVRYFYRLADSLPLTDGAIMKSGIASTVCAFWKPKLDSGETNLAVYNYAFKDGQSSFNLTASDCQ